jgi:hypothetical protein
MINSLRVFFTDILINGGDVLKFAGWYSKSGSSVLNFSITFLIIRGNIKLKLRPKGGSWKSVNETHIMHMAYFFLIF